MSSRAPPQPSQDHVDRHRRSRQAAVRRLAFPRCRRFFIFSVVFPPRPAPQFCGRRFGIDVCRHLVRVQTERQG